MDLSQKIPTDLLKQDPSTGMYKLGGIEMTPAEYSLAVEQNKIKDALIDIQQRLTKVEGK